MPAESRAQRRAAGVARAIQKGKLRAIPGTPSAEMAQMPAESLEHFAKTPEKGLPEHKVRRYGANKQQRSPAAVRTKKGKNTRRCA